MLIKKSTKNQHFCGEILGIQEKTTKIVFLKLIIIGFVSVSTNQLSEYPNVRVLGATKNRKTQNSDTSIVQVTHWFRICQLANVLKNKKFSSLKNGEL